MRHRPRATKRREAHDPCRSFGAQHATPAAVVEPAVKLAATPAANTCTAPHIPARGRLAWRWPSTAEGKPTIEMVEVNVKLRALGVTHSKGLWRPKTPGENHMHGRAARAASGESRCGRLASAAATISRAQPPIVMAKVDIKPRWRGVRYGPTIQRDVGARAGQTGGHIDEAKVAQDFTPQARDDVQPRPTSATRIECTGLRKSVSGREGLASHISLVGPS